MDTMTATAAPTTRAGARSIFDAEVVTPLASGAREATQRGIPCQLRTLLYRGQDGGFWTRSWAEPPCERTRIEPLDHGSASALYQTLPVKLAPLGGD